MTASIVTGVLEAPVEIARSRIQAGVVHTSLLRYLFLGGGFLSVLPLTVPNLLQVRLWQVQKSSNTAAESHSGQSMLLLPQMHGQCDTNVTQLRQGGWLP